MWQWGRPVVCVFKAETVSVLCLVTLIELKVMYTSLERYYFEISCPIIS